jgi:hypothetical protein
MCESPTCMCIKTSSNLLARRERLRSRFKTDLASVASVPQIYNRTSFVLVNGKALCMVEVRKRLFA